MNVQSVYLHITQVEKAISICNKTFDDAGKQKVYDGLIAIFKKVKAANLNTFTVNGLKFTRDVLNIVYYGVEHLNHADQVHLLYMLKLVLNDWLPNNAQDYFIVVSRNKSLESFVVRAMHEELLEFHKQNIKGLFKETYEQSLIQISKPELLFEDFLGSVPVYHEIGHFIDKNYQITFDLFKDTNFLPQYPQKDSNGKDNPERVKKIYYHYAEHFADIFAAQYVGDSILHFLNYFSATGQESFTHPSTQMRLDVVNAFINGSGTPATEIIKHLKEHTKTKTKDIELEKRSLSLDVANNPFLTNNAVIIQNPRMVHSLLPEGWKELLNPASNMHQACPNPIDCCKRINELIKQTITSTMPQP